MIRALYTAASGLLFGVRQQEVAANNLANAGTTGYKGETAAGSAFAGVLARRVGVEGGPVPSMLDQSLGRVGTGVYQSYRRSDFSTGILRATGEPLDLAIAGPGFFAIQTPNGVQYTRDGHFGRDRENRLVTSEGLPVLGADGQPIVVASDRVRVTSAGEVIVDDTTAGTLRLVTIDPQDAVRAGNSRFSLATGEAAPLEPGAATALRQGVLEEANVDVARSATSVMSVSRAFEASQHVFSTVNETLERSANDVGRVA